MFAVSLQYIENSYKMNKYNNEKHVILLTSKLSKLSISSFDESETSWAESSSIDSSGMSVSSEETL